MRKLALLVVLFLAGHHFVSPARCADTNQLQKAGARTNSVQEPSSAELQDAAQQVWQRLLLFGILTVVGGIVIAAFAVYGAYKAFGIKGVVGVGIIIVLCCFVVGSILIEAF